MSYTKPQTYEHSVHLGNIPDFVLTAVDEYIQVDVYPDTLYLTPVFSGSYMPDPSGEVRLNFADIFRDFLKTELPNADVFLQRYVYRSFGFVIKGLTSNTQSAEYYDVLLSKADVAVSPYAYMQTHFLTLQPIEKRVTRDMPEHLTLNGIGPSTPLQLYARFYPTSGGSDDVQLDSPANTGINTFRFDWQSIWEQRPVACNTYFDIVANDGKVDLMMQRYLYENRCGREHYFVWVNALGGIDTICCTGANALTPAVSYNVGTRNGLTLQLDDSEDYRQWTQQSGWFPWKQREWLWDFISSKLGHWLYDPANGTYTEIVLTTSDMEASDNGQLVQFTFGYRLSRGGKSVGTDGRQAAFSQSAADSSHEIDYDDKQNEE